MSNEQKPESNDFEQQANQAQQGIVAEFMDFLVHNKAWWITPIVLVLGLLAVFVFLSASGAAPFIYPMF